MKKVLAHLKYLDKHLQSHWILTLVLLVVVVLRIPNLLEPYWYGDEGIYLAVGNGMKQGSRLYAEIIDHKTPLIYYLAMVPNQLSFRLLNIAWMITTTVFFYQLTRKLLAHPLARLISSLIFVLLTTLPGFEGNLPNGELFMMGFVVVGGWWTLKTLWPEGLREWHLPRLTTVQLRNVLLAGGWFGLAILVKVPALFDMVAFAALGWLMAAHRFIQDRRFSKAVLSPLSISMLVGLGATVPILGSVLYFMLRGSGQAYLDYGLLYNFRYAGNWQLPITNTVILALFSLPGKAAVTGLTCLVITGLNRHLKPALQFSLLWFWLALFASLLSNRPYPHYFLQVMPAVSLLFGALTDQVFHRLGQRGATKHILPAILMTLASLLVMVGIFKVIGLGRYPTRSYYQRFMALATGKMSWEEYRNSFSWLMEDNYRAADIIRAAGTKRMFIWGTNPTLYALTDTAPTGRFTVSFHIKDFDAYQETFDSVQAHQPEFIVVMKDEPTPFPQLYGYLDTYYMPNANFKHFRLWKRL